MLTQQLTMLRECRDTGLLITAPDSDRISLCFHCGEPHLASCKRHAGRRDSRDSNEPPTPLLLVRRSVDQVKGEADGDAFVCFAKAAVTRTERSIDRTARLGRELQATSIGWLRAIRTQSSGLSEMGPDNVVFFPISAVLPHREVRGMGTPEAVGWLRIDHAGVPDCCCRL